MVGFPPPQKIPPFWWIVLIQVACQAQMAQYLCSTNADETLHGDQLPVATHIRPWEPYSYGH